jgi:hypothetical protein
MIFEVTDASGARKLAASASAHTVDEYNFQILTTAKTYTLTVFSRGRPFRDTSEKFAASRKLWCTAFTEWVQAKG